MNPSNPQTRNTMRAGLDGPPGPASVVLALVGSGGDGVALLGDLVLRMAARLGLYGIMVQSYGPQIRGGESAAILRLGTEETTYEGGAADLLLCFRASDLARFRGAVHLHERSIVLLEAAESAALPEWLGSSTRPAFRFPFATFENGEEVPGEPKNMLALGLLCRALGWPAAPARAALEQRFGHRPEALAKNLAAFERGFAADQVPELPKLEGHGASLFVESGNEAVARAAIQAGVRFFAGYPITPSSEIMETLLEELPVRGGRVVQAEDEIAALGMVLGASFGGVPAMTATSGPGLSLMTEMIGLASMAELPAVIVDCQRAGPATGMPSRTEQSDLLHAVYGGHGDFPRVVLGAFDVVHARDITHQAVTLAERFQLPVLMLSDAYIAQRRQIRRPLAPVPEAAPRRGWTEGDGPLRFALEASDGVNPFRIPGTAGATYLAAGIEHTPQGWPTADGSVHHQMNEKRFRKLEAIARETAEWYRTLGDPAAPRGLIGWGSQYGLLREWVALHPEYRAFLPEILHPFPVAALERWRQGLAWTGVVELSFQGQLHRLLGGLTDMRGVPMVGRSGGLPLSTAELGARLEEVTT
jgi:2-oxoglutarate ferredoxin oxidoreductase subunit alpha